MTSFFFFKSKDDNKIQEGVNCRFLKFTDTKNIEINCKILP